MVRMALTRPLSQLTIQSFGDISRFLREGVADEESRQMRDSMVVLAQAVDTAVRSRRARSDAVDITRHAAALVQAVRAHQLFLTGLGSAWHSLYEFGAYQNALRELRRAVESWHKALVQRGADEGAGFDRMELLAWRTLGEGLLLIDMYEQGGQAHSEPPPRERRPQGLWVRALNWWGRARR
jgi:hypothetical protein